MQTSQRGIDLIKTSEGLRLVPYQDGSGHWTVGWGHKLAPGSDTSSPITPEQAEDLFMWDLRHAERAVERCCAGVKLTQGQFDALVDFAFNFGEPKFASSTLLALLRKGDYQAAADELPKWVHDGGKIEEGLVERRRLERQLFLAA